MNTYAWLIKREFWENRAIWVVPSVIGVLLVLLALFGRGQFITLTTPQQSHVVGQMVLSAFGVTFFVVMSIYSTWYLLDCLYGDRKDRSVLFWKSLPISDTATVLSKLLVALIVIPLVYFVAADVTTLLIAFIVSVRASAALGGALWHADLWLQLQILWLYVIITTAIWFLPVAAWLMVISAWAKRAVMLWTVLPPLALYLGERWIFGTRYVAVALHDRLLGYAPQAFHTGADSSFWITTTFDKDQIITPSSIWALLDPAGFFSSPQTWIGVAVGAALVAGAIQLRLRRTEI
jgi:ABC-2 type transport system permease protein